MIKIFLLVCLSSVSILLHSQIQSGKIIYRLEQNTDNIKIEKNRSPSFQDDFLRIGESLQFELHFNATESAFKLSESMSLDYDEFKTHMAIFILRGNSVFNANLETRSLVEYRELAGEKLIIKKNLSDFTWELSKDSKEIQGYKCYKAIGIKYGKGKDGNITETPIIAWFAPEITFQFGPYESAGLPGLVLQYELAKFKWIVDTMRLDEKNSSIKIDKSGREITEEEIDLSIKKRKN